MRKILIIISLLANLFMYGQNKINSSNEDLVKEAIKVVSKMPKWKPGEQRGKKVRVKYIIPVVFK